MPTVGNGDDIIGQSFTRGSENFNLIIIYNSRACLFVYIFDFTFYIYIESKFIYLKGKEERGRTKNVRSPLNPIIFDINVYIFHPLNIIQHLFIAKRLKMVHLELASLWTLDFSMCPLVVRIHTHMYTSEFIGIGEIQPQLYHL